MKKITIEERDGKVTLSSTSKVTFPTFLQLTLSAILCFANNITTDETKGIIYDDMNNAFSRLLEIYDPELEMRPDITSEAILELENKLLEEQYEKHKKKSSKQSVKA